MRKDELESLSDKELRRLFEKARKELLALRNEIDRREGPPSSEVDFESYITK